MANGKGLFLKIGNQIFLISSDTEDLLTLIKTAYKNHLSSDATNFSFKISFIGKDKTKRAPYMQYGRWKYKINIYPVDDNIMVTSCIFSGYVNLKEKKAEISIQIDPEYVYICLRFITALFLPETKGLLIHASSIVHDDTAYLFIGKSNAGKTTMTDLSPDKNILCDDFSIVMNINGKFTVFPSPFWGTLTVDGNNDGRSYPLKAMYLLYQSDENFIRPFSSWLHKIHALHPQILVFANLPQHSKKVFDLENELIEKTKMSKLHFSLDGLVWRCIEDEEDAICKR